MKKFLLALPLALWVGSALAQDVPNHAIPIGRGPGVIGWGTMILTTGQVVLGSTGTDPIAGTLSGNTSKVATVVGTLTNGHCVSIDSNGNLIDAGGACTTSGGGGTVNSGTAGQLAFYSVTGSAVSGETSLTAAQVGTNLITSAMMAQAAAKTVKCNNTNALANLADCTFIVMPQTVSWFANDTPAANINRFNDSVLVGDAAQNYPANTGCPIGDWFTNFHNTTSQGPCAYIGSFEMVVLSKTNNTNPIGGLLGGGQSAQTSSATNGVFGLAGFALENKTGVGSRTGGGSWGIYGECDKTVNNGANCYAIEVDVMTTINNTNNPDPFTQGPYIGSQIGCGSGLSSPANFHCSAAIQIVANSQPFNAGIVFINNSLATGAAGGINAVAMPLTYSLAWYSSANTAQGSITVDNTNNLNLNTGGTIKVNGTGGVTCAGAPSGAFATLNGIVTHC